MLEVELVVGLDRGRFKQSRAVDVDRPTTVLRPAMGDRMQLQRCTAPPQPGCWYLLADSQLRRGGWKVDAGPMEAPGGIVCTEPDTRMAPVAAWRPTST